jgi:hypothetical protein
MPPFSLSNTSITELINASNFPNLFFEAVAGGAAGTGGAAAGGTISAPEPSAELQALLGSIPFANDGDVITADHFNTLRAAIARLARSLDDTQFAKQFTQTFAPTLLPVPDTEGAFRAGPEGASGPAGGSDARGWLALDLPDGADVESLTVRGRRPSGVTIWTVALRRVELANDEVKDVCQAEIQTQPTTQGRFSAVVPAAASETVPSVASNLRRVDTSRYRYLFDTEFAGAQQADAIQINAVQVTCRRD